MTGAVRPLPARLDRVLVIKLGALGDFVQALGPMQAIRRAAPDARMTLLTTPPFVGLARRSGWFDSVLADGRPKGLTGLWRLRRTLRAGRFDMVFDLQTSDRSSLTWHLMRPDRPPMSGIARGCSHPHDNPARDRMHTIDRQRDQLARCGITDVPLPDVGWMDAPLAKFGLPDRYALLVPGGAPHRPDKRWPAANYADLARHLDARGLRPVLIGTAADGAALEPVRRAGAVDLVGKTDLLELAAVARGAALAVGNDTGPMHLAACAGCPSVVLYSHASDPALCGQHGPSVEILRVPDLADLSVESVAAMADGMAR